MRPYAVWKAAKYLVAKSELYKDLNIQINASWLSEPLGSNTSLKTFIQDNSSVISDKIGPNDSCDDDTHFNNNMMEKDESTVESDVYSDPEDENNTLHAGAIEQDTLLEQQNATVPSSNNILDADCEGIEFAPGEGQKPVSLFYEDNAEYLSFPTIFCGQTRSTR